MLAKYGQGDVLIGQAAIDAGLADALGDAESVIASMQRQVNAMGSSSIFSSARQAHAAPSPPGTTTTKGIGSHDRRENRKSRRKKLGLLGIGRHRRDQPPLDRDDDRKLAKKAAKAEAKAQARTEKKATKPTADDAAFKAWQRDFGLNDITPAKLEAALSTANVGDYAKRRRRQLDKAKGNDHGPTRNRTEDQRAPDAATFADHPAHIYAGVMFVHSEGGRAFIVDDNAAANAARGFLDPEPRILPLPHSAEGTPVHVPTKPLLLTRAAFDEMKRCADSGLFVIELDK